MMIDGRISSSSSSGVNVAHRSPFKSSSHQQQHPTVEMMRGKLPNVCIPRKQLEEIEKDGFNEYDEITPYATFSLQDGVTTDSLCDREATTVDDEFKTFTVRIGEPAYCFKVSHPTSRFLALCSHSRLVTHPCDPLSSASLSLPLFRLTLILFQRPGFFTLELEVSTGA